MFFNDDEPIVAVEDASSSSDSAGVEAGKTKLRMTYKRDAPLEENNFKLVLELTGDRPVNKRLGVDIVAVLDTSASMQYLDKVKVAMQFLIKKLRPIDRLSVVTFSRYAQRQWPLRQMTESSQAEAIAIVNALGNAGASNISDGLRMGLRTINDRRFIHGRVAAVMLMSDDHPTYGDRDASTIPVHDVPVHTFAFGDSPYRSVLNAIARNSNGGTFSVVDVNRMEENYLNLAFAQCLGGLQAVAVQDLRLTIAPVSSKIDHHQEIKSDIKKVFAGNYLQSASASDGSITVLFDHIYIHETRKVLVDLLLPPVTKGATTKVIQITYSYSIDEGRVENPPVFVAVNRSATASQKEREEVTLEATRLEVAKLMQDARFRADNGDFGAAEKELVEALNLVEDVVVEGAKYRKMLDILKSELRQLQSLMISSEVYSRGRNVALAFEVSHDRQRAAVRGDTNISMFETPEMRKLVEQAKSYANDPSKSPPPIDDSHVEEELDDNNIASVAAPPSHQQAGAHQQVDDKENFVDYEEEIAITQDDSAHEAELLSGTTWEAGKTKVKIIAKKSAPLQQNNLKVTLELTPSHVVARAGVDIVTVLDVGMSLWRFKKMKVAMRFLMSKLSPIDSVSIVTTTEDLKRPLQPLCPLTSDAKEEIEDLISALRVDVRRINITILLQTALEVLGERSNMDDREAAIILFFDQSIGMADVAQVPIVQVPIYAFEFGRKNNPPSVLKDIAECSNGGKFSLIDVEDTISRNLSGVFSECLARLLTMAVPDVTLTVSHVQEDENRENKNTTIIQKVSPEGFCLHSWDDDDQSVTLPFGHLYINEMQPVVLDVFLTPVPVEMDTKILRLAHIYSVGKMLRNHSIIVTIKRTEAHMEQGKGLQDQKDELMVEEEVTDDIPLQTASAVRTVNIESDEHSKHHYRYRGFENLFQ